MTHPPTAAQQAALAALAGHPLPPGRAEPVAEALAELMACAESLDDLDLEGVEPMSAR